MPLKSKGLKEQATFAAGCFWGVEAAYQSVPGVLSTAVGFMGGNLENPTYEEVCTKNTNHAEVVNIEYNFVWDGTSTGMPRTMGRVMIEILERNEVLLLLPHHLC